MLTLPQAESRLLKASNKTSKWQDAAGYRFRIYRVSGDFDCHNLPAEFEVLFTDAAGDCVIRELIDEV